MQGEVITALTAAEQRATDAETRVLGVRGEGVVDTRLLGKPKSFDGSTDSWRQFKFTFSGYEVLAQTFKGDVRGSLDEFDVKIRRYERSCDEVLSDRVKIAVVQKGIEDEDLRRHVLMHASRFSTYPLVREEIRSIIMARETLNGPTPMDVSAVYKGKKGKEKGKGKGKKGKGKNKGRSDDKGKEKDLAANPDAEIICHYCHRKGHRKRDCRTFEKGRE